MTTQILALPDVRTPVKLNEDGTARAFVFGRSMLFQDGGNYLLECWQAFRLASQEEADSLPPVDKVF